MGAGTNGPGTPPFGVVGTMPWLLLTALAYASLASCMAVTKSMIGGYHANLRHVSNAHAWLDITTMTPNCDGSSCTWFSWTCARRLEATIETIGNLDAFCYRWAKHAPGDVLVAVAASKYPTRLADTGAWCRSAYPPLAHFLWTTPTTRTICCCAQALDEMD